MTNNSGASEKEIIDCVSKSALVHRDQFIREGLAYQDTNTGRYHAHEKNFSVSDDINFSGLQKLLKIAGTLNKDEVMRKWYLNSESLQKKAVAEIQAIKKRAYLDVRKVLCDKKSQGEIPFFTFMASGSLASNLDEEV